MNGNDLGPAPRRLPRETRNLLIAACVALITLWVLARVRFPDRPVTQNPISPVLTQMTAVPAFEDLASEVRVIRNRIGSSVVTVPDSTAGDTPRVRSALRLRRDAAVIWLPQDADAFAHQSDVLVTDRGSGLAIVHTPDDRSAAPPVPWAPTQLTAPRFLMATAPLADGVTLHPVFIGGLFAAASPAWSGPIWILPAGTNVPAGTLLFTHDGELVGLSVDDGDRRAVVPGDTVLADAQRLLDRGPAAHGELGITAQGLTEAVAAATGADRGVVVTWVAPHGAAADRVRPGDVIDTMNGIPIGSAREWQVRSRRVTEGEMVVIDVRRDGDRQIVELIAAPAVPPSRGLGLLLRFIPDLGSEVVRVEPGSVAALAGIRPGDVITAVGALPEPTPDRVRLALASAEDADPVLVAFTRGNSHHVTALPR